MLDAATRPSRLARDHQIDSAAVLSDTEMLVEFVHRRADTGALPEIVSAPEFVAADIPEPDEIVHGGPHKGSKSIVGGAQRLTTEIAGPASAASCS